MPFETRLDTVEKTQREIVDALLIIQKNQKLILANLSQKTQAPLLQTSSTPRLKTSPIPQPQTSPTPQPLDHLSPLAHPPPNLQVGEIIDALPSSAIDKESLSDIEDVINHYPKLQSLCKAGSLSCKLAREAVFRGNVLKICTAKGNRHIPGLPSKELDDLSSSTPDLFYSTAQDLTYSSASDLPYSSAPGPPLSTCTPSAKPSSW